ncbi:MAG: CHAD domain-containing protein [Terriglobales bacterium]
MLADGSSTNHSHLNVPQNQGRLVFARMNRYIGRLSKDLTPENVHHFRTNSRRVEALIETLAPETRNKKKALKLVATLRKRAGKVRDIDVQIGLIEDLKVPDRQSHRARLLELLDEEHDRHTRKLSKAADASTLRELKKRLRREQEAIQFDGIDPLRLAMKALPRVDQASLTEKNLHDLRLGAKHARYLAELAGENHGAKAFVGELKRAQRAAGDWHDALKLKQRAERHFGSASESALVSVLQNISRARFRSASNALISAVASLSKSEQLAKLPAQAQHTTAASEKVEQRRAVA